jgi:D-methionine transport system substrate-binding protein
MRRSFFRIAALALGSVLLSAAHAADGKALRVGVTAGPHAQIVEAVKKVAEREGLKLQIVEFSDYIQPNAALNAGELDVNVFQHKPFLDAQIRDRGYRLSIIGEAVRQQFGIYSKKVKSLADLASGARVGIPNDPSNGARALLLLEDRGVLRLKDGIGARATPLDIVDNPKKLRIVELEAAQLPRSLDDLDAAAVNSNYAVPAGLVPSRDALALERPDSPIPFAQIVIAARTEGKDNPELARFVRAYRSPEVRDFVNAQFKGAYTASW